MHGTADVARGGVQGLPASLKDSCKRTLEAQGVRMRSGRVTKVGPGRESVNGDVGKQVTVELSEGGTVVEDSDIVCWTAGAHLLPPHPEACTCVSTLTLRRRRRDTVRASPCGTFAVMARRQWSPEY